VSSADFIVIVEISKIEEIAGRFGEAFEQHYFTVLERQASRTSVNPMQYFASRLAAKLSVLKTLGLEESVYPLWQDIEVQRLPTGEPTIALYARYQELVIEQGITKWLLSISHTPCYAAASAIVLYHY